MRRAQGHIANVLCVLFDHVIDRQRNQLQAMDVRMEGGKYIRILRTCLSLTITDFHSSNLKIMILYLLNHALVSKFYSFSIYLFSTYFLSQWAKY